MRMIRHFATIACALATLSALQEHALGQCEPWSTSFAPSGVGGSVYDAVEFDDGSGSAYYVVGLFDTAGSTRARNVARWNGTEWSAVGDGFDDWTLALAVYDDGSGAKLYAGGFFTSADGAAVAHIARWNGGSWSPVGAGIDGPVRDLVVFDDGTGAKLYATGNFATAGGAAASSVASWNGTTWSALGAGIHPSGGGFVAGGQTMLVHDDGGGAKLHVGGSFDAAGGAPSTGLATWNGSQWSNIAVPSTTWVTALALHDAGSGVRLHVAGRIGYAHIIARRDPSGWTSLGGALSGPGQELNGMRSVDTGNGPELFVGGWFDTISGVAAKNLARWRNGTWSALGGGTSLRVNAIVAPPGISANSSIALLGDFGVVDTTPASAVAVWDGTRVTSLGSGGGITGNGEASVKAVVMHDSGNGPELYAAGVFQFAGNTPASAIAHWNGLAWTPLGSGIDGTVEALASIDHGSGPKLYAAGTFTSAGGVPANHIARWDGTSWSALGVGVGGPNARVSSLAVFDDGTGTKLYVGGSFTTAGGITANRVARWNGVNWSAVGSGFNDTVEALRVLEFGSGPKLHATGSFSQTGPTFITRVAVWTGASWASVGAGLNGGGMDVAAFDLGSGPELFVSGSFVVSSAPASLLRFTGGAWTVVAPQLQDPAAALAVFDDGTGPALYVGSCPFAAPDNRFLSRVRPNLALEDVSIGGGFGTTETLEVFDAGGDGAPDLVAGGLFNYMGASASQGVAIRLGCLDVGASFCSGDGSATPCPCGNSGASGHGCANSVDPQGARLSARGAASASADSLVLSTSGLTGSVSIYVQGTAQDSGGLGTPLFDGLRCVGGDVMRLGNVANSAHASEFPSSGGSSLAQRGLVGGAGGTRHYQVLYRNVAASFCPPGNANWSNGLSIVWTP